MKSLDTVTLLGTRITNAREEEILEYIIRSLGNPSDSYFVVTPNPEIIVYATRHPRFQGVLNHARIALSDGVGVMMGARMVGTPLKQRITGTDFMERFCSEVSASTSNVASTNAAAATSDVANANNPITVGFLGGRGGVACKTAECLIKKYPGLNVVFAGPEWGDDGFAFAAKNYELGSKNYENEGNKTVKDQRPARNASASVVGGPKTIDLLFVAYGFPKQEEWMAEYVGKIPVTVMMGVGGAFDYLSGSVARAPLVVRRMGLEWFYRLILQPWRWRRQFALLEFVYLLLFQSLKKRSIK